ncbi:hypothetical protein DAPPUDRAFT_105780 [Daphnia pulex]|uniref:Uncharacterized protein n=1 Tax=Daphnia pulex TaxID=6669 RepID=E9GRT1_DAPPU|nr:hypothetical protein DAPPUDRAFT_105780 [Daphnia pulex]|eukprot:EFX77862.1 hypothetical protein DAPPUDRAFT_105780 [Daphnia pulex]
MKVAFSPDQTAVDPDSPHLGSQNQTQRPETDEELKLHAKRGETEGFVSRANRLGFFNNLFSFFMCGLIFCRPPPAEDEVQAAAMPLPTEEKSSVTGQLNYSDRRDTEEEAPDSAVYISSRRGILGLVKFSQAPFSLCPYPMSSNSRFHNRNMYKKGCHDTNAVDDQAISNRERTDCICDDPAAKWTQAITLI